MNSLKEYSYVFFLCFSVRKISHLTHFIETIKSSDVHLQPNSRWPPKLTKISQNTLGYTLGLNFIFFVCVLLTHVLRCLFLFFLLTHVMYCCSADSCFLLSCDVRSWCVVSASFCFSWGISSLRWLLCVRNLRAGIRNQRTRDSGKKKTHVYLKTARTNETTHFCLSWCE